MGRAVNTVECEIHVTGQYGTPNVAAGGTNTIIPVQQAEETIVFNCTGYRDVDTPFWIIADEDVFVTVIFKSKFGRIRAYQVYPVDVLGKEMMGITNDGVLTDCFFATIDYPAKVKVFYEGIRNLSPDSIIDGATMSLQPGTVQKIAGSEPDVFKGVLFMADRRVVMFCGDNMNIYIFVGTEFYQVPPTENLGKEYVTPAFEPNPVERPFDATLLIQADSDNTLVEINGDFEAIIPIYKRGNYAPQF